MSTKRLEKLSKLRKHPDNPRLIKGDKYKLLINSIIEDPDFLEKRPLIVNKDLVVIGGNMRLEACRELGWKETWIDETDWTEEKQRRFLIKDNSNFGEWDNDVLANEWEQNDLNNWGLDLPPIFDDKEDKYTAKVETPSYDPKNEKPLLNQLVDTQKTENLIVKINKANISKPEKEFLIMAAQRHQIFNYSKIADYYSQSNKNMQELMEDSALIIIDFDKAIEDGYVEFTEVIKDIFNKEYD
tara:strand:- start:116 stop:841 length:726 start_codon:yes stop_codon:yes gene_type:complete